jgi:hypothetical protein
MSAATAGRRRSPQPVPRPRVVKFFLTDEELAELDEAAGQAGLARGAFAAEVTMAAAGRAATSNAARSAPGPRRCKRYCSPSGPRCCLAATRTSP